MAAFPGLSVCGVEPVLQHTAARAAEPGVQGQPRSDSRERRPHHAGAPLALGLLLLAVTETESAFATPHAAYLQGLRAEARTYEHGEGVARDPSRAVELYCTAARLGDAEAQYSLGWMYANGRGVVRDDGVAALFFARAAAQGHEHASRMLRFVGEPAAQLPECLRERQRAEKVQQAHQLPRSAKPSVAAEKSAVADDEPAAAHNAPALDYEEPDIVDSTLATTPAQKQIAELVNKLAPEYGVSPRLAFAVIRFESNFDPTARSHRNAQGLMQLIPETAARFNVRKPYDPVQNVHGGLAYLRWLLAYFRGNVPLVLAAYNAGEGAVNRHRGIPPFAETRAYVNRVMSLFGRDVHPYDPAVTRPSPELERIRRR
jgi:soluble lytic murein transglycosylase-like protein